MITKNLIETKQAPTTKQARNQIYSFFMQQIQINIINGTISIVRTHGWAHTEQVSVTIDVVNSSNSGPKLKESKHFTNQSINQSINQPLAMIVIEKGK